MVCLVYYDFAERTSSIFKRFFFFFGGVSEGGVRVEKKRAFRLLVCV